MNSDLVLKQEKSVEDRMGICSCGEERAIFFCNSKSFEC